jgi:hypothetical protein
LASAIAGPAPTKAVAAIAAPAQSVACFMEDSPKMTNRESPVARYRAYFGIFARFPFLRNLVSAADGQF